MAEFNGNNDLNSREMLINRKVYDGYILTLLENVVEPTLETAQIKDFQKDEKMLYGRLDSAVKNTIFPRSGYLKTFPFSGGRDGLQAMNFVVDAFTDMKAKFDKDKRNGASIDPLDPVIADFTLEKAYVDPLTEYSKFRNIFKSSFLDFVIKNNLLKDISDFNSSIPVFMQFVSIISKTLPVTRTMYLLSKYVSPRTSGLVLEIYDGDYGDDRIKAELFYNNSNFEYLKNLAYVFGFMIDKHIPWRLVADLNSPRMKRYIRESVGPENPSAITTLPLAYVQTYPDDINSIVSLLVECYNEVARFRPVTKITSPASTINKNSAITAFGENCRSRKTIYRLSVEVDEIRAQYPESYWLTLYAEIRNMETGMQYNQGAMRTIVKNATDLTNSLDSTAALGYIARKFDNVEHFVGSLFYDLTRLDLSENPEAREADVQEKVLRSVQTSNFIIY